MSLQRIPDSSIATTIATPFPASALHAVPDRATFWKRADEAKETTRALAAEKMAMLPRLSVEALRLVCTQYRFFTIDYIRDLALLIAKLPFGGLRSLLSDILSEELGEGDAQRAHPVVYDRFLASLGIAQDERERPLPDNRAILDALTAELLDRGPAFGIGLRGMGGECLCQTYLTVLHEHLLEHPYVRAHGDAIDWEFWTIHTGEIDIVHGELTRRAVDDYLVQRPDALPELAQGYERSIGAWNAFWQNIFDAAATPRAGALS